MLQRRDNLPETLRKPRMLTSVVAIRVPEEFGSVDAITSMFRPYGVIALVRLLRKGKDVSTQYICLFSHILEAFFVDIKHQNI